MRKRKKPDTSETPPVNEDSSGEEEFERQTQEKAELVPPARRPPTAVGAATPPRPPRPPARVPEPHPPPLVFHPLQDLRELAGAILELVDVVADAIRRSLRGEP